MIISPTSKWKKVLGRCCLIVSGGITRLIRLTIKIHISSTCFGIGFVILKFGMQIHLETNSIRVDSITVPT
jgi:hypothetical protein